MTDPYRRFDQDELIVRDLLAIDRTILANERTLLAYVRTALAFVVSGVTALQVLDGALAACAGWGALVIGVATAVAGVLRFLWVHRRLARRPAPTTPRPPAP